MSDLVSDLLSHFLPLLLHFPVFLLPSLLGLPDSLLPFPLGLLFLLLVIFVASFAAYRPCGTQEKEKRNSYVSHVIAWLPVAATRVSACTTSVVEIYRPEYTSSCIHLFSVSKFEDLPSSRREFNNTVLRERDWLCCCQRL